MAILPLFFNLCKFALTFSKRSYAVKSVVRRQLCPLSICSNLTRFTGAPPSSDPRDGLARRLPRALPPSRLSAWLQRHGPAPRAASAPAGPVGYHHRASEDSHCHCLIPPPLHRCGLSCCHPALLLCAPPQPHLCLAPVRRRNSARPLGMQLSPYSPFGMSPQHCSFLCASKKPDER